MVTPKRPDAEPRPAEKGAGPGPLPTDGDTVREIGKRAYQDALGPRKDTDQEGRDDQRRRAPDDAPTHRSDKTDGNDDR